MGRAATIVGISLEIPWSFAYMILPLVAALGGGHFAACPLAGCSPADPRPHSRIPSLAARQGSGGGGRLDPGQGRINQWPPRAFKGCTEAANSQWQVRKCLRSVQKCRPSQKHYHHVLPLLHQQFCLLRPHPQLGKSHPGKFTLQHYCQRTARDRCQRDHHLCPPLPWAQALCLWEYGHRRGDLVRSSLCRLGRWESSPCTDRALCYNRIFLHGVCVCRGNISHRDQECWTRLCLRLGSGRRDYCSLYWSRTRENIPGCAAFYFWSNFTDSCWLGTLSAGDQRSDP